MDASAEISPQQVTHLPLCGTFYFHWHRHQVKGTNGFLCIFRKTQGKWGKRTAVGGFEPLSPGGYICEGIVFEL